MNFDWAFFESYNGFVYITELDTNRLVYMNARLRNSIGFGDGKDYKGLMCYDVLQGKKEPCEFCTNQKIQEGKFISWTYHNPLLKKECLLNDTMVCHNGKRYRVEIAMDMGEDHDPQTLFYARNEQILSECLRQMFSTADENQAIHTLLQYIGETFSCERVYIFELSDQKRKVDNTYEWCADGVTPQKDFLQNVPYEGVDFWFDIFDKEGVLSIADLEDIRESYPLTYAYLQPQDIQSLMVGPIQGDEDYIGFIGADNPDKEKVSMLSSLIRVIGYFVSVMLKRRDLTVQLQKQSYRDTLTGALNRNALSELFSKDLGANSLGIVYCDISGLKQINDLYGHAAGDKLILQGCRLITSTMDNGNTYRIGGDEFVVTCLDMTEQDFQQQVKILQDKIAAERYHIAVGSTWTNVFPASFDELLRKADQEMYQDKRRYYSNSNAADRRSRRREPDCGCKAESFKQILPTQMFNNDRAYACIGDYRSNCFYISDGLKEKFGFSGNVVYDFLSQWEERIIGQGQKQLYRKNLQQILQEKETYAKFSYVMQDGAGNVVMVRCSGLLQWDEAYTEPLTLLGIVQVEQDARITDPITSFPSLQCAIDELQTLKKPVILLLFKLNHFGKINEAKGRDIGNCLLKNIAADFQTHFSKTVAFYRLEGLKFMGVCSDEQGQYQEVIDTIREIVTKQYKKLEISVAEPLTFIPIEYSSEKESPMDLLQNVSALISAAEFSPELQPIKNSNDYLDGLKQEINMEFALTRDIQNQMANFRIVVQPVVSVETEEILGGEVLLRWMFQGKDVAPKIFIPIIEREKLMGTVGKWVLEQTVQCCRNLSVYRPDMYLTFNVSYQQILSYNFADTIKSMLQKYGIDGNRVVAELTETHEDAAPIRLQAFIDSCEKIGVQIALDDFGNGYSTLGLLLKYSAQIIKLDQSILKEISTSEEKKRFVHGLVESCHKIGKRVCIEGVETEEERAAAIKVGCDIIQGFYYYKPLELYDLYPALIKSCSRTEIRKQNQQRAHERDFSAQNGSH